MNENAPDKISEGDRGTLDALHAELPERERNIGESLRTSVHSEANEAPPMPDDLLEEVLSDLGVKQSAARPAPASNESMFAKVLTLFRSNPIALGVSAAAACFVVIVAVNLSSEKGGLNGNSGIRGGGSNNASTVAPLVILFQPTGALREAVETNFNEEHLRFPATEVEMRRLVQDTTRIRIVVREGAISTYLAGATDAASEVPLPEAADDAVDAIGVARQGLE